MDTPRSGQDPAEAVGAESHTQTQRSIGELIAGVTERFSRLIRDELELAQLQAKKKVTKLGIGAVLFVVAGVLALYMLGFLLQSLVYLFAQWVPMWAAALIVVGILLLIIIILLAVGAKKMKASKEHVIDPKSGLQNSVSAVKKGLSHE